MCLLASVILQLNPSLWTNADLYDAMLYKILFHLMACAIIYCATLQDDLLTTGARNATRAKHQSISLSCGQWLLLVSLSQIYLNRLQLPLGI